MDHDHGHHGGMDHGDSGQCNMNMLFTWDTKNLCIVFRSWRITDSWSLLWSLAAIVALTAGYEAVREASRRYEAGQTAYITGMSKNTVAAKRSGKIVRAAFYGVQVFYSFFIMLLFMTYNGWVMIAVGVGAFIGYLIFGNASATKTAACH